MLDIVQCKNTPPLLTWRHSILPEMLFSELIRGLFDQLCRVLGLKWAKIFFQGGLTVVPGIKPTVYSVGSFLPREDPAAWPKRQMFFLPFFQGWQMFLEWSHWSTSLSSLSGWADLMPGSSLTLIMQLEAGADLAIQPYLLTHTLMPTTEPTCNYLGPSYIQCIFN